MVVRHTIFGGNAYLNGVPCNDPRYEAITYLKDIKEGDARLLIDHPSWCRGAAESVCTMKLQMGEDGMPIPGSADTANFDYTDSYQDDSSDNGYDSEDILVEDLPLMEAQA